MQIPFNKNEHDLKCVWMSAGIVNYKLCDRDFDCEHCEFHRVMRGISTVVPSQKTKSTPPITDNENQQNPLINQYISHLLKGCALHLDRYYHSSHFWYKKVDPDHFQLGIDPLGLKILHPITRISLPEPDEIIQKGQLIAWIVRKEVTVPLYSPVKCTIITINKGLSGSGVENLQQDDSWLMEISGENLEDDLKKSCGMMGGIENFTTKIPYIQWWLQRGMNNHPDSRVGLTMGDGGELESDIENIIGKKLYQELLHFLFHQK